MKEQSEKTWSRVYTEPRNPNGTSIQNIMAAELAGHGNGEIAKLVGLTEARVSVIRNSPLYKKIMLEKREQLHSTIIEKRSDELVGVHKIFQEAEIDAAKTKVELLKSAQSESVRNLVATEILAYRGIQPKLQQHSSSVIEITEKMANRFERALERGASLKIRTEIRE